ADHHVAVDDATEVAEARVAGAGTEAVVNHQREGAHRHARERQDERDTVTGGAKAHRGRAAEGNRALAPFQSGRDRAPNWKVTRTLVPLRPASSPPRPQVSKIGVL